MRKARRMLVTLLPLIALALPAAARAAAEEAAPAQGGADAGGKLARAGKMIGEKLVDSHGWEVGRVDDFFFDPTDGRIVYALVAIGGRFQANREGLALKLPDPKVGVDDGYLQAKMEIDELRHLPQEKYAREDLDKDLRARLHSMKALLGAPLRGPGGEKLGSVQGAVVDVDAGVIKVVVVDYDQSWHAAGKMVALPQLTLQGAGKDLAVLADPKRLASDPPFVSKRWPGLSDDSTMQKVERVFSFQ